MENSVDCILIDGKGQWWYEGNKIIHPEVLALFKSSLTIEGEGSAGQLFIDYKGKQAPVKVEKTPFFIHDIEIKEDRNGGLVKVILELDDGTHESLDPESLVLDDDGALQVKVKGGRFEARCLPSAHFRLAELLKEDDDGGFSINIGDKSFSLAKNREKDK